MTKNMMKFNISFKNLIKIFINTAIVAVFILPLSIVNAQDSNLYPSDYTINNFTSDINVERKEVKVKEQLDITFNTDRHGIFRYLPDFYEYHSEDGTKNINSRLKINVNSVTDEKGNPITYQKIILRDVILNEKDPLLGLFYDATEIKIGDPNTLVIGNHTYVINYTIENFPENADPFIYGLTGTGWSQTINKYQGNIEFEDAPKDFKCEKGVARNIGNEIDCTVNKINDKKYSVTASDITPASGVQMTVTGLMFQHSIPDLQLFLETYWYLPIPFIGLFLLFLHWRSQRSPKGTGVVTPQFGIPENLRPAEIGTIYDDSVDKVDISATIIDLAVKGYLKIVNNSKKENKADLTLVKAKPLEENIRGYELLIMNGLFSENADRVSVKDLAQGSMTTTYNSVQETIYLWGIKEGYFKRKPDKLNNFAYAIITTIVLVGPGLFFNLLNIAVTIILGIIVFLISAILFYTRQYKSSKGVLLQEKIQGLKLFIEYAKKDQLEMLSTPLSKQEIYEQYLPYAMVFNMHKAWTEAFKDMNLSIPNWYEGYSSNNFFTNLYILSYINSLSDNMNKAFTVPPSSTGSGFLGGVGGGSMGGGFSGGGGGSW